MKDINTQLPLDEQNEDEQIITIGDSILSQFYYGNYSDAIGYMVEDRITPKELAEYLEGIAEEFDVEVSSLYNGHFTMSLFACIGESYRTAIMEVA